MRGTVRMTARVLRPSVDVASGAGHARAEGPEGSRGRPVESPAFIASVALDVPVHRSTACGVCAHCAKTVGKEPVSAVPAGRMPRRRSSRRSVCAE